MSSSLLEFVPGAIQPIEVKSMSITIYHNPRCSKSRKTLEIINSSGIEPTVVRYLQNTPDATEIIDLAGKLGMRVADLLRRGESAFKDAADRPDLDDDDAVAAFIESHPILLQRPIVVDSETGKAVVGRPPENVLALLS